MSIHPVVEQVTERIIQRSVGERQAYLQRINHALAQGKVARSQLSCTNLAHGMASMPQQAVIPLKAQDAPNLAIVSAYNDMLSAHQPLGEFPAWIKDEALRSGASAQFAGGVPAMCDGVTQGQAGMELSLFSRDVIAMATAVALSHQMFDAALYLGVCDKIVPGLLIGALAFGHLPAVFVPAGPMTSGLSNADKAKVRQRFAAGEIGRDELLASEMQSYHAPGTCTFYGTANSNQMLMEVMGLHLPGTAFVNPYTPMREALTRAAARQAVQLAAQHKPVAHIIDERSMVNAIVGLLASGGSTNHTIHLVTIARAAGIRINWDDFESLSAVVPLLARMYPNGDADVNRFHASGGMGYFIRELLDAGLLHEDVETIVGKGLHHYTQEPWLDNGQLAWRDAPLQSGDDSVLRPVSAPFDANGGIRLIRGPLGRAIIKVSAVKPEHRHIDAPAIVFDSQQALLDAFQRGELERDFFAVIRWQGPRANGMPELHKLTPTLGLLQERGFHVALVTDGRMSGASGKVPAVLHVTPEATAGGPLANVRDGDCLRLDADAGTLDVLVDEQEWAARLPAQPDLSTNQYGVGRELFNGFRAQVIGAEQGASSFGWADD